MSSQLRRSIVLATSHRSCLVDIAQNAEAAGFYRVWCTESLGSDALVRAQLLLASTTKIKVATGIAYAFTRSPVALAVASADCAALYGGRFTLGIGAGTKGVRRRYGIIDFDHPAPRMAEYVEVLRAALDADRGLRYEGRYYTIEAPGLDLATDRGARVELYGAAVQPTMVRYMASACDGVALHGLAVQGPVWEQRTVPALERGAAGRERPRLAAWVVTAVHDHCSVAIAMAKRQLAFYLSTPTYSAMATGTAWAGDVDTLARAARSGASMEELSSLVTPRMVDELTIAGTPTQVREKIEAMEVRLAAGGVDELVFQVVNVPSARETLDNALAVIDACKPDRSGEDHRDVV